MYTSTLTFSPVYVVLILRILKDNNINNVIDSAKKTKKNGPKLGHQKMYAW